MEEKLDKLIDYMVKKFDHVDKQFQIVRDEAAGFRSEIWEHIDSVYKEVLAMRQEQTVFNHQLSHHDDSLDNHEKRLKYLESSVLTTHTIKK